jgi:hypothetical protein
MLRESVDLEWAALTDTAREHFECVPSARPVSLINFLFVYLSLSSLESIAWLALCVIITLVVLRGFVLPTDTMPAVHASPVADISTGDALTVTVVVRIPQTYKLTERLPELIVFHDLGSLLK